ncbi:MAG: transporter [Planctomycetaceae bacterium]|nr:transporter [Planctomycetaceae bacterium]
MGYIDWTVLIVALSVSISVGLLLRGREQTLDSFLLGDRSLPWWAILGSIVATETSTATVLSVPGHGISPTGLRFLQLPMGLICGRILVVVVLLPLFYTGKLSSAYQVLRTRFGLETSRAAAGLFLATRSLGDGLRLYLAALVIQQLLGWNLGLGCAVITGATIVYTLIGGMRSIVWNDCIQWCIYMLGGLVSLGVIVSLLPAGWDTLWEHGMRTDKWRLIEWSWDQDYNFWSGLIGGIVLSMGTHGTDHMMVQRYLSARSQREAAWALIASGLVVWLQFALFILIGIALASFYEQANPAAMPSKPDQVFAHFILNVFPANSGLVGLMMAAIFAASMSTLSSSLSSSASAFMHDFVLPAIGNRPWWTTRKLYLLTQILTLGFGSLQMMIGIQAQYFSASVIDNSLKLAGFSGGLLLGLFLLGLMTRKVGQLPALLGTTIGAATVLLCEFGGFWPRPLGVPWLALVGATTTLASGSGLYLIGVALFPHRPR